MGVDHPQDEAVVRQACSVNSLHLLWPGPLVRTDTLKRLRPEEVIKDYKPKDLKGGPSYTIQGLKDTQRAKIGDFTVWDTKAAKVVAISRDEVGQHMPVEPALTGTFPVTLLDGTKVDVMPIF